MSPSPSEKYSARIDELLSLEVELAQGRRPDVAPVVGRLLEAAGDLLRRRASIPCDESMVRRALVALPEAGLRAWAEGVNVAELRSTLSSAASHAVEAAIPDSDEDGARMTQWAMQGLFSRDRAESFLVALAVLADTGRTDAKPIAARLRAAIDDIDATCRCTVASLTALNAGRRTEAGLLDELQRARAWWFSEKNGLDCDGLVAVLGGEKKGLLPRAEKAASDVVMQKRARRVTSDDLLRYDLGLATQAEQEAIRRQAENDPELKLALVAMAEGDRDIDAPQPATVSTAAVATREAVDAPVVVEDNRDFKVLVFRNPRTVQVVVQPRDPNRFAAAALFRDHEPDRPLPSRDGEYGVHFDLGAPERVLNSSARLVVQLANGESKAIQVRL